MENRSLGIYCTESKTFYYLETGKVYVKNTVDRLKRILTQRKVIGFSEKNYLNTHDFIIKSVGDAIAEDLSMQPIYISEHVREEVAKAKEKETTKKTKWG